MVSCEGKEGIQEENAQFPAQIPQNSPDPTDIPYLGYTQRGTILYKSKDTL